MCQFLLCSLQQLSTSKENTIGWIGMKTNEKACHLVHAQIAHHAEELSYFSERISKTKPIMLHAHNLHRFIYYSFSFCWNDNTLEHRQRHRLRAKCQLHMNKKFTGLKVNVSDVEKSDGFRLDSVRLLFP